MVKKKLTYLGIVLTLTVVFLVGITLGWSLSNSKFTDATKLIRENELNTESFLIEQELFETLGSQGCDLARSRLDDFSTQLYQLGQVLGKDTAKKDLGNQNYNILKRRYHLLQLKTYTITYKFNSSCGYENPVFLFYYSQTDPESKEQGIVLDKIVEEYEARVFAIEYDYSPELIFAQEYYNITQSPAIIINYEHRVEGLASQEDIESFLAKP